MKPAEVMIRINWEGQVRNAIMVARTKASAEKIMEIVRNAMGTSMNKESSTDSEISEEEQSVSKQDTIIIDDGTDDEDQDYKTGEEEDSEDEELEIYSYQDVEEEDSEDEVEKRERLACLEVETERGMEWDRMEEEKERKRRKEEEMDIKEQIINEESEESEAKADSDEESEVSQSDVSETRSDFRHVSVSAPLQLCENFRTCKYCLCHCCYKKAGNSEKVNVTEAGSPGK